LVPGIYVGAPAL